MIKTINMRNCASYDETGVSFSGCNKVNFIYGHNGSGKSTISNFMQDESPDTFRDCSIEWELGTEAEILVYNKNFRLKNLQSMPGVFTLGEATAEQIKHLEELKSDADRRRNERIAVQNSIQKKTEEQLSLTKEFEANAWETILKKNESVFLDAFAGLRSNKSKFSERVLKEYEKNPANKKTRASLEDEARVLFGKRPESLVAITIPDTTVLREIETDEIWQKVIVGNKDVDMAALINYLNNSDWVKAGIGYINRATGICPFCQKRTIDDDVIDQLNQFFSGEYERQLKLVEDYTEQYRKLSLSLLVGINNWITSAKEQNAEFSFEKMDDCLQRLELQIEKNTERIEIKHKEPSRQISLDSTSDILNSIGELMGSFNNMVIDHNRLVDDYTKEKGRLIDEIWALLIDENRTLIKNYTQSILNISKAINGMREKESALGRAINDIQNQIIEESKSVTSVQPTVDAINRALKAYGFEGFRIVASKENLNQYQILRPNGMIATDSLSEGEETFISFLYFVYMTQGGLNTDIINAHKVIVIDDPICSLDSSILYVVSSLVRELTTYAKKGINNIDQVFVLTHNVYFHKEVSFLDGRNQIDPKVSYWVLNKKNEITTVQQYGNTNPITTTYALLWKEVKESNSISRVSLQNAMRRILENFFGTLGNANIDEILKHFEFPEEKSICRSLFSWSNDGSHSIPDDLDFSEDNDSSEKYRKVFKDIFYNTNNQYHYDRMME